MGRPRTPWVRAHIALLAYARGRHHCTQAQRKTTKNTRLGHPSRTIQPTTCRAHSLNSPSDHRHKTIGTSPDD